MIRVSVMYPNEKGKRFDLDYFVHRHVGLVHKYLDSAGLVPLFSSHIVRRRWASSRFGQVTGSREVPYSLSGLAVETSRNHL
jgi:hypothetical protein